LTIDENKTRSQVKFKFRQLASQESKQFWVQFGKLVDYSWSAEQQIKQSRDQQSFLATGTKSSFGQIEFKILTQSLISSFVLQLVFFAFRKRDLLSLTTELPSV